MSEFNLTVNPDPINFMPSTVAEEVIQNIRTLLNTTRGSVPMDRDFGVNFPLDEPLPGARQKLNVEIIDAIEKYEPRARVIKVRWSPNAGSTNGEGSLAPTVQIRIQDA